MRILPVTRVVVIIAEVFTQRLMPFWIISVRTCRTVRISGGVFYPEKGKNHQIGKKLDLIVIRVNTDGDLCISRPCYNCLSMMKAVNIRRVYYVDSNRNIVYENVRDMISIHASSVTRLIHTIKKGIEYKGSESIFFSDLLKKMFPPEVKRTNFETFVNHDLKNVLPDHSYIIKSEKDTNIVIIMDGDNKPVIKSKLIG